jgi:hypothetical protein
LCVGPELARCVHRALPLSCRLVGATRACSLCSIPYWYSIYMRTFGVVSVYRLPVVYR